MNGDDPKFQREGSLNDSQNADDIFAEGFLLLMMLPF